MLLELLLFVNYSQMCRRRKRDSEEFIRSCFEKYFRDFDKMLCEGACIYSRILFGTKSRGLERVSLRLLKISKMFGMSQILENKLFQGLHQVHHVKVIVHMIYWMTKPIVELISHLNDPKKHGSKPIWGARRILLPAPSYLYSNILMIGLFDYRLGNVKLACEVRKYCETYKSTFSEKELTILTHWAIEALMEFKDADARMFGYTHIILSPAKWIELSLEQILKMLEQSDILARALHLFLRQKRQSIRQ